MDEQNLCKECSISPIYTVDARPKDSDMRNVCNTTKNTILHAIFTSVKGNFTVDNVWRTITPDGDKYQFIVQSVIETCRKRRKKTIKKTKITITQCHIHTSASKLNKGIGFLRHAYRIVVIIL